MKKYKNLDEAIDSRELSREQLYGCLMLTTKGTIRTNSRKNVALILRGDKDNPYQFRTNDFNGEIQVKEANGDWGPLQDNTDALIGNYIESSWGYIPPTGTIREGIKIASSRNKFNPVKDRIEFFKWDGIPRVETFFIDYLGAPDTKYTRAVTTIWLVGMVARVYEPGVKFDLVPILTGPQGIGKSTLVSLLIPNYFTDQVNSLDASKKDEQLKINQVAIVELSELSSMKKTSIEAVKGMITATRDLYRAPYSPTTIARERHTVFIGTTNDSQFLIDKTGNRRFLPVQCGTNKPNKKIPKPNDHKNYEILQVLAEALVLYREGKTPLYLPPDIVKIAEEKQKKAMVENTNDEKILAYVDMLVPKNWDKLALSDKKRYFERVYYDSEHSLRIDGKNYLFDESELRSINVVTTREILECVFNEAYTRNNGIKLTNDIRRLLVDDLKEWKKKENLKIPGITGRLRGYERIARPYTRGV